MNRTTIYLILGISLLGITNKNIQGQNISFRVMDSPPPGAEYQYIAPKSTEQSSVKVVLDVPDYLWSYGCTSTAAAMLVAYYDRNGFDCLYRGAKNGGKAPLYNISWKANHFYHSNGSYTINYLNSISASNNGYDGRTMDGHVDSFWKQNGSTGDPKPYTGSTPPHPFEMDYAIGRGHCVADWMGTNQDYWNTSDGATKIFSTDDGSKLFDYIGSENSGATRGRDGMHGLRLYIEDQTGYSVDTYIDDNGDSHKWCYNQEIDTEHNLGFTFDEFMNEIDDGRPVLVSFYGHTTCGIGYRIQNDGTEQIRINDTWQTGTARWIDWGGQLEGLDMYLVSVVKLYGHTKKGGSDYSCEPIVTGINDYISLTNPPENHPNYMENTYSFNLEDQLSYYCAFYDVEEYSWAETWNWKITLDHSEGEYELLSNSFSQDIWGSLWQPICPTSLPDYFWSRNEDGAISGKLSVECIDSDGYRHEEYAYISLYSKPNKPNLKLVLYTNNSTTIQFSSSGNNTYKIYYGNNLYAPFSGTNAHQGNSVINVDNETTYTLSNLNNGDVITVTATNSYGESSYSNPIIFSNYTTIPYSTDFESGVDDCWTFKSDNSNGRIVCSSGYGYNSSYGLAMDVVTNGTYAQNYADLHLCLINAPDVILDFWWKDYGDEFHQGKDGVWLSDDGGANFVKVIDLNGSLYSDWKYFKLSIPELAREHGLALTKNFVVRFAQYDNYPKNTDGFAFDDISVYRGIYASVKKDAQLMYNLHPTYNYLQNTNYGDYSLLSSHRWTYSGYTTKKRALIGIDLNNIPQYSTITNAKLSLFSPDPQSSSSYKHYSYSIMNNSGYKSNASYLQRVTENWDEHIVTWNNQPSTTTLNQVILPESDYHQQNYIDVNITNLAQDLYLNAYDNLGLKLQLQTDSYYSQMVFASSDHEDESLHPILELDYSTQTMDYVLSVSKDATLKYSEKPGYSYIATTNYGNYNRLMAFEWTNSGYRTNNISVLDFDLSTLNYNPKVIEAKIRLYACNPQPNVEYKQMSYLSTGNTGYKSNASWLRRITSAWDENTVTYNTMPDYTTVNQVYLPISESYIQDYIDIDVTALVNDMINDQDNSFGLMLQLANEEKYTNMVFASSDHENSTLRPKLIITSIPGEEGQKSGNVINTIEEEDDTIQSSVDDVFEIYPNPATNILNINSIVNNYNITIIDISGRILEAFESNSSNTSVNCENWTEGIYIIQLTSDDFKQSKLVKIVK